MSDEPEDDGQGFCAGSRRDEPALDIRFHEGTCPVCLTRQQLVSLSDRVQIHRENVPSA